MAGIFGTPILIGEQNLVHLNETESEQFIEMRRSNTWWDALQKGFWWEKGPYEKYNISIV